MRLVEDTDLHIQYSGKARAARACTSSKVTLGLLEVRAGRLRRLPMLPPPSMAA